MVRELSIFFSAATGGLLYTDDETLFYSIPSSSSKRFRLFVKICDMRLRH